MMHTPKAGVTMRLQRYGFMFLAIYIAFVGGAGFYATTLGLRLVHHTLMTALIVLWFVLRIRRGEGLPVTPLNPFLYALVGVWLMSAVFSIDPRQSFEKTWYLLLHLTMFLFVVNLLQHGRRRLVTETLFVLGGGIVLITLIELAIWYFGIGESASWFEALKLGVWLPLEIPDRLELAMSSTNWLGGYVAPLALVTGGYALTKRGGERRALWILAGALVLVLLGTRTRGAYLSFAVAVAAFAALRVLQIPNIRARLSPRVLMGGGVVLALAALMGVLILVVGEESGRDSGDLLRIDMMNAALEITADHPILGVGTGGFGRAYRDYRAPERATDRMGIVHNFYLAVVSENGIIGGLAVIAVGGVFALTVYRLWKRAQGHERIRREAILAALAGLAVHGLVDVFQTTQFATLTAILFALLIVSDTPEQPPRKGQRLPAILGAVLMLAYGVWLVGFVDRANLTYQHSLVLEEAGDYDQAIDATEQAYSIDRLNLYPLHIAWLQGEKARISGDTADVDTAIQAYRDALTLEPTWDTGWLNLAALLESRGANDEAFAAIERAYAANARKEGSIALARRAEQVGGYDDSALVTMYEYGIYGVPERLPLSAFWGQSTLSLVAVRDYAERFDLDVRYRIYSVHLPDEAAALVPQNPQTAAEHWISGQVAYTQGDMATAATHFDRAVQLAPTRGDYYASRARATWMTDPDSATRDLLLADLLAPKAESPNWIRAQMTDAPQMRRDFLARAVTPRSIPYEFSGVLYNGRYTPWDVVRALRFPGPGHALMQGWYALAEMAEAQGDTDYAAYVYGVILDNAPDETEAAQQLNRLENAQK